MPWTWKALCNWILWKRCLLSWERKTDDIENPQLLFYSLPSSQFAKVLCDWNIIIIEGEYEKLLSKPETIIITELKTKCHHHSCFTQISIQKKKKNINEKKNNNIECWMSWKITNENVASTFSLKQLNKSTSNFGKWFISMYGKQTKSHCLKNTNCWVAAALLQMTIQIIKFLHQLVTITNVSQTQSISKAFVRKLPIDTAADIIAHKKTH